MKRLRKILKVTIITTAALATLFFATKLVVDKPLPEGEQGEKAEALTQKILQAINHDAWENTAAVSWNTGRHQHLWDRKRNLARVKWKGYTAYVNCNDQTGYVLKGDDEITNEKKKAKLLKEAYKWWVNDVFWLNPMGSFYNSDVTRAYVKTENLEETLLVTYSSGGVTPGDSYLWYVDENGLPYKWEMWVKIIPFKGAKATWENWKEGETGARYASKHDLGIMSFEITDVKMTTDLSQWFDGQDPFEKVI